MDTFLALPYSPFNMIVIVLVAFVCFISGAEIIVPKSSHVRSKRIKFDTDLNNLVVDRNNGNVCISHDFILSGGAIFVAKIFYSFIRKVYIGGRNRLYQLTSDLEVVATVKTGENQNDSIGDNINKVLLIDYSSNSLITCASNRGQCSTRNLQNISLPEQNVVSAIVSTSESKVLALNEISKVN